jgi:hypothetical protein
VLFYVLFVVCRSLYCLCVYVYCTTGWLPNCSKIYHVISIYLQKNSVHFVGWVLWYGNVYENLKRWKINKQKNSSKKIKKKKKKKLPYSHNVFDSVHDYKTSPIFFPEEKSVKNFCLMFAWIWQLIIPDGVTITTEVHGLLLMSQVQRLRDNIKELRKNTLHREFTENIHFPTSP